MPVLLTSFPSLIAPAFLSLLSSSSQALNAGFSNSLYFWFFRQATHCSFCLALPSTTSCWFSTILFCLQTIGPLHLFPGWGIPSSLFWTWSIGSDFYLSFNIKCLIHSREITHNFWSPYTLNCIILFSLRNIYTYNPWEAQAIEWKIQNLFHLLPLIFKVHKI